MIHKPEDFEIIDAHTHPFIDPAGCIGSFGYPKSMEEFDFEMRKVGITRYAGSVLGSNPDGSFEVIRKLNREALRVRDRYPGYIPGIHINGRFPEESCTELHRMYDEGVRMAGEVLCSICMEPYNAPGMLTIFREMEKLGMPASLHHGMRGEILPLVEACPDLKIMLAHPGETRGEPDYHCKDRLKMVAAHKNLYIDISGYGLFRWGMLRWAIDTCGVEKIIFGSDMPTCSVGMYLYGTLCENLTDDEFRLVLAGNFKRLLGIR